MMNVDCVYIAASARDARFTRICVASVRHFYPNMPIQLLVGGPLQQGLARELQRYWGVTEKAVPKRDYGWGFVKLEPLFDEPGHRFLVLDSDTVMAGRALDWAASDDSEFIVDDERQTADGVRSIYYDVQQASKEGVAIADPEFVFNTGQWVGSSGLISRDAFEGLINWGDPPKLINSNIFKNGEQGVLNFVINKGFRNGDFRVKRVPLMRWPGFGLDGLDAAIISRREALPCVIHWAGMKRARQSDMVGADILTFFEKSYYQRLPWGGVKRHLAAGMHALSHWMFDLKKRIQFRVAGFSGGVK